MRLFHQELLVSVDFALLVDHEHVHFGQRQGQLALVSVAKVRIKGNDAGVLEVLEDLLGRFC